MDFNSLNFRAIGVGLVLLFAITCISTLTIGVVVGRYVIPSSEKSVGHRCVCGCEETGQCKCPNCSVGCGFIEGKK